MVNEQTKYWIFMMKDNSGATLIGDDDGIRPPLDKDVELGPDLEGNDQGTIKAGTFTVSDESHDMEYCLNYVRAMLEIPLQTMIDAAEETKLRYDKLEPAKEEIEEVKEEPKEEFKEEISNHWILMLNDLSGFHLIQSDTRPTHEDILALNSEFDEPRYWAGNYELSETHYTSSESAEYIADVVARSVKEKGLKGQVTVKVDGQSILIEVEENDENNDDSDEDIAS